MTQLALVVLGQHSVPLARHIMTVLPEATLYGLANRTADVDVHFTNFGDTVRELFSNSTPIISICAAGILIRVLAPLLTDKWREPPVLAVAEDGSAVVPLLGGLHGVNDLARQVAEVLHVAPAITTTGDIRFHTALLSPPAGYHLANPDHAKTFIADVLAGASVKLVGEAHWLRESQLPMTSDGPLTIQITERAVTPRQDCLVYHPLTVAIGMCRKPGPEGNREAAINYNPVSKQRTWQLHKAREILLQWRSPLTPVILARNLGRPGQAVTVQRLDQLTPADADMRTIILVGSSQTRLIQRDDGRHWVYTPRHYAESQRAGRTSA